MVVVVKFTVLEMFILSSLASFSFEGNKQTNKLQIKATLL